jgi:hypothetical protein
MINALKIVVCLCKIERHFRDLGMDGALILKWVLNK